MADTAQVTVTAWSAGGHTGQNTGLPSQGGLHPQLADSATCPLQIQWGEMGDLAGANES